MNQIIEVDARGLSCPEPVLLTANALKANPGAQLRIMANEAHVRMNVEKLLRSKKVPFETEEIGSEYVILTK